MASVCGCRTRPSAGYARQLRNFRSRRPGSAGTVAIGRSTAPVRNEIASALRTEPDARPDDVARSLSTSASTVRDVRKRLQSGADPVPVKRETHPRTPLPLRDSTPVDWSNDKAILSLPGGSGFAEWLSQTKIESRHWEAHLFEIPLGRIPQLIAEAKTRAAEWTDFAAALEKRFKELRTTRVALLHRCFCPVSSDVSGACGNPTLRRLYEIGGAAVHRM